MEVNLFTSYYAESNEFRRKELDECFHRNASCTGIDAIHVFGEATPPVTGDGVHIYTTDHRPTYADFISWANNRTGPDDINILCNADIYFDDNSIAQIKKHLEPANTVLALSRWDVRPAKECLLWPRHYANKDSQDVWAWRGKLNGVTGNFTQGKRGCDNRLAWEIAQAGYFVKNPSKSVKTYHLHNSGVRHYSMTADVDLVRGPYMCVEVE